MANSEKNASSDDAIMREEMEKNPLFGLMAMHSQLLHAVADLEVIVLLPLTVSLEGVDLTVHFLLCHILLVDPQDRTRFVALDGSRGVVRVFDDGTTLINLVTGPPDRMQYDKWMETPLLLFGSEITAMLQTMESTSIDSAPIAFFKRRMFMDYLDRSFMIAPISAPLSHSMSQPEREIPPFRDVIKIYSRYTQIAASMPIECAKSSFARPLNSPDIPEVRDYKIFFDKLRDKVDTRDPIRISLKRFTDGFLNRYDNSDGERVTRLVDGVLLLIMKHPQWRNSSTEDVESIIECLERFVMLKIYDRAFPPNGKTDANKDLAFHRRVRQLSFVQMSDLDLPEAYMVHHHMMEQASQEIISSNDGYVNADEFLPLLIWIVLCASPHHLPSNLRYISRYRNPTKLISETSYYFTNFELAVSFIENLDATHLKMTAEEFERKLHGKESMMSQLLDLSAAGLLSQSRRNRNASSSSKTTESSTSDKGSTVAEKVDLISGDGSVESEPREQRDDDPTEDLMNERMARSIAHMRKLSLSTEQLQVLAFETPSFHRPSRAFRNLTQSPIIQESRTGPYRFEEYTLETLKMGDIPALLSEYKLLAAENRRMVEILSSSQKISNIFDPLS